MKLERERRGKLTTIESQAKSDRKEDLGERRGRSARTSGNRRARHQRQAGRKLDSRYSETERLCVCPSDICIVWSSILSPTAIIPSSSLFAGVPPTYRIVWTKNPSLTSRCSGPVFFLPAPAFHSPDPEAGQADAIAKDLVTTPYLHIHNMSVKLLWWMTAESSNVVQVAHRRARSGSVA